MNMQTSTLSTSVNTIYRGNSDEKQDSSSHEFEKSYPICPETNKSNRKKTGTKN